MKNNIVFVIVLLSFIFLTIILSMSSSQAETPNTWVSKNPGEFAWRGWGRFVYRPVSKSILFYEGYNDGGLRGSTIYANTLYSWDIAANILTRIKVSNWGVGPPDYPLPENTTDPTPANRHTYRGFEYVPTKDAVYMVGGANSRTPGLDLNSMWVYSFQTGSWRKTTAHPDGGNEGHLNYVSGTNGLFYMVNNEVWKFDLSTETWANIKSNTQRFWGAASNVDSKRNLIVFYGGDDTKNIVTYDPATNTFTTQSTAGPTLLGQIVYNSKWDVYMVFDLETSNTWIYYPITKSWEKLTLNTKPTVFQFKEVGYAAYDQANDLVGIMSYGNGPEFWTLQYVPSGVPGDTTAPTVSIIAPSSGSTVSGSSVTISANASDNVGVVGVQFKLDGANLGSEDTTAPYLITWNTTQTTNGSHILTATARDAAGNQTISSGINITVNNTVTDTSPPTIPANLSAIAVSSSQINLSWSASSDNVGVTGYRIYRGGSQLMAIGSQTTYLDTGLSPSTLYSYTVSTYDAAGNNSGQSNSASATTQASTPPPPSSANTLTIYDTSGTTQTNRPVSIARPTKQGDIPQCYVASINSTPVLTQTDVKNRWPDGSVKFAIVSFVIPNLPANGSVNVSFLNQTSCNNTGFFSQAQMLDPAYNFEGVIEMQGVNAQTASARQMLQNGDFRYWLRGPVVTAVIIEGRTAARKYDKDFGDNSKSLHPIFEAWFYPSNKKVNLGYTIENIWASIDPAKSARDLSYSLTLKSGNTNPTIEFTHPSFNHIGLSRWYKEFWLGADPGNIRIDQNFKYLVSTKMIPNFDASLQIAESLLSLTYQGWLTTDKTFDGDTNTNRVGLFGKTQTSAGAANYITSHFATEEVLALFTSDNRMIEAAIQNTFLQGRGPFHYREADERAPYLTGTTISPFGRTLSKDSRPTASLQFLNSGTSEVDKINLGPTTNDGYILSREHWPPFGAFCYIITGKYWCLEETQFSGAAMAAWHTPGNISYGGYGSNTYLPLFYRDLAHSLRSILYGAVFTPDGDPEKTYFDGVLRRNIAMFEGLYNLPLSEPSLQQHWNHGANVVRETAFGSYGKPPLNFMHSGGGRWTTSDPVIGSIAGWAEGFIVATLGQAKQFGYPTRNILNYIAGNWFNIILNPDSAGPAELNRYQWPTIVRSTGTWAQNYGEFSTISSMLNGPLDEWDHFGETSTDHGYMHITRAALSFLTDQVSGGYSGETAWTVRNAALPQDELKRDFQERSPKWAILPVFEASSSDTTPPSAPSGVVVN